MVPVPAGGLYLGFLFFQPQISLIGTELMHDVRRSGVWDFTERVA